MFKSLVLAGAMALTAIPAQAQTCTRDYLKTFIVNYFKAVETHDLSALPTAPNLRVTENGVETKPGEGFVKTGGKATLLRSLLDTERCGTVTQALVDETINGVTDPTIVAVRLKVVAGRVTEIETLLGRKGASKMAGFDFYNPKALLATKDHRLGSAVAGRPAADARLHERAREPVLQQLCERSDGTRCELRIALSSLGGRAADDRQEPELFAPRHGSHHDAHASPLPGDRHGDRSHRRLHTVRRRTARRAHVQVR